MKKFILFSAIVAFSALSVQAQVASYNPLDSWKNINKYSPAISYRSVNSIVFRPCKEVDYNWSQNPDFWNYQDSIRNTYNSLGNITQKLIYGIFSPYDNSQPIDSVIFVYNSNDALISETQNRWYMQISTPSSLKTYSYDANNNLTEYIHYYNWNGTSWDWGEKEDFTYDTNNNRIQHTIQLWNGTMWDNVVLVNFTWIGGQLTQEIWQYWDSGVSAFINGGKADYTYVSGQLNEGIEYTWNGTSWQNSSKYINMVWFQWFGLSDVNNKLTSQTVQVPNGNLWKDTTKINITYDSFGNQTDFLEQAKPNTTYLTAHETKDIYQYDADNNITQDITQNWVDSTTGLVNSNKKDYSEYQAFTGAPCTPPQPGTISGNSTVTAATSETYSVTAVTGATSYLWNLPSGWSGSSTINSITVTVGTTSGTISVSAVNGCGASAARTLAVTQDGSGTQTSDCSPALFKDLKPGSSGSSPSNFRELNGSLYFIADYDLWKTNGTVAGTIRIDSLRSPREMEVLNNNLIFSVSSPAWQLWKSDGISSTLIKEFPGSEIGDLTSANGFMFFRVGNYVSKLWRTDGTAAGTILVKDIDPSNSVNYAPGTLFAFNNNIYFSAGTTTNGVELWKSDGTEAGTTMVKDIYPGVSSGHDFSNTYAILNNELYTYAKDPLNLGLWKTDGTDAGTTFIKECLWIGELTNINNVLYFYATDIAGNTGNDLYGSELWKSDGTLSGTHMVKDIKPGVGSSILNQYNFCAINSSAVFRATDDGINFKLWKTNGTETGTMILNDFPSYSLSSSTVFNGFLYFSSDNGITGYELWKTDGTEAGTALVADLLPGSTGSSPSGFTIFNGTLFFTAQSASAGMELWSCVASSSSISDVKSENSISVYPNPSNGIFQLSIDNTQLEKGALEIYNLFGERVYSASNIKQQMQIDLSAFSKGIYFVKINSGDKIYSKKIVVQ